MEHGCEKNDGCTRIVELFQHSWTLDTKPLSRKINRTCGIHGQDGGNTPAESVERTRWTSAREPFATALRMTGGRPAMFVPLDQGLES